MPSIKSSLSNQDSGENVKHKVSPPLHLISYPSPPSPCSIQGGLAYSQCGCGWRLLNHLPSPPPKGGRNIQSGYSVQWPRPYLVDEYQVPGGRQAVGTGGGRFLVQPSITLGGGWSPSDWWGCRDQPSVFNVATPRVDAAVTGVHSVTWV